MRCAVYVRVSTDKEEQKASFKYQKELFYRYIAEKGWDFHKFYFDVQSGTTTKREELQKMIEGAEAKKFDIILAKELSRLARNGELSYKIKNLCESQGIHIITLDNAIKNTHMFGLYAWIYENESQSTSNRVKATYMVKNGKLHIRDDNTPDVVRKHCAAAV